MLRKRLEHSEAISNMLDIIDVIGVLTSNKLSHDAIRTLGGKIVKLLAQRNGLVPPSECTITLHELFHVVDQSYNIGCPRYSNLYKFEKVNKFLKGMLKNVAKGFASIMKNYMQKESIFFETAINSTEIASIDSLQKFLPKDIKSMKNLTSFVRNIYIDVDENNVAELLDIDSCNVLHFFGEKKLEKFNVTLFSYLLHSALEYPGVTAPDDSLLQRLFQEWKQGPGSKKPEAFFNWLKKNFNKYQNLTNNSIYMRYHRLIVNMKDDTLQEIFEKDYTFLTDCFSQDAEEVFPDNYLYVT